MWSRCSSVPDRSGECRPVVLSDGGADCTRRIDNSVPVVSSVRVISDPEGARERLVGRVIIEYTVRDAGEESADLDLAIRLIRNNVLTLNAKDPALRITEALGPPCDGTRGLPTTHGGGGARPHLRVERRRGHRAAGEVEEAPPRRPRGPHGDLPGEAEGLLVVPRVHPGLLGGRDRRHEPRPLRRGSRLGPDRPGHADRAEPGSDVRRALLGGDEPREEASSTSPTPTPRRSGR